MSNTANMVQADSMVEKLVLFMESVDCPTCTEGAIIKSELTQCVLENPTIASAIVDKIVSVYAEKINQLCEQYAKC